MDSASTVQHEPARLSAHAPRWRALAWLALAGGFVGLCAADTHTALPVSVNVLPVARAELTADVPPLLIRPTDLARGYIDVPRPLRLRVTSNSRAGFALDVTALSPWFTAVALAGLDSAVSLGPEGGTVVQRWQGAQSRTLELRVRFMLAAGVQPGLYAWPLQLTARPL